MLIANPIDWLYATCLEYFIFWFSTAGLIKNFVETPAAIKIKQTNCLFLNFEKKTKKLNEIGNILIARGYIKMY
jgi:hypothetical protein